MSYLFENAVIGTLNLKNRIIRSATFEGMCDENGFPQLKMFDFYDELSQRDIGLIISGFAYVSKDGKAMQIGQLGIDEVSKVDVLKKLTDIVHKNGTKIALQIAHTGRQTRIENTKQPLVGASNKSSVYFRGKIKKLSTQEAENIVEKFALSACFAKDAGFDAVQIHAAHGYLVHQFLHPAINNRKDKYGIDFNSGIGTQFLSEIIDKIREKCGDFPILVKVSGSDDLRNKISGDKFVSLIKFLDKKEVDAIEISYGTMDYALNIFRGSLPLDLIFRYNPIYKINNKFLRKLWSIFIKPVLTYKLKPFSPVYNLKYSKIAKKLTSIPIISVGGFRTGLEIKEAIENGDADFVALSRPFICEPDFVEKIKTDIGYKSKCTNCNKCAIMCDSENVTKCYGGKNDSFFKNYRDN